MGDRLGQQIGNYRLVKLLGKGGFAEVYLSQHVRLAAKQAAIKILHLIDVDARKFQEEAETTEKLVHPHIVRLLDFDIEEGTPFLVLDYAPGGSLRACHPKGSMVPLASVGVYLKEIASALQYAHDLHILHRDIKPDNMLIGRGGELLLSDFGIAVLTQTGRTSLSSAYGIGGTPYYMAPETYRGRPVKESDQYALAVVVYEWLCGSVPFSEGNFIQLGFQHSHEPVPPLREKNPAIPREVEAVIMKALAKEPKDRFASVQTFVQAFEQACIQARQAEQERLRQAEEQERARQAEEERLRQAEEQARRIEAERLRQAEKAEQARLAREERMQNIAEQTPPMPHQPFPPTTSPEVAMPPQDQNTLSSGAPPRAAVTTSQRSGTLPPRPILTQPKRQRSPAVVAVLSLLILILLGGGSFGIYGATTRNWPWSQNISREQSTPVSSNTSIPGQTWTVQNSGLSEKLLGVVWSGSQFVVVGQSGAILTSPNGNAWTRQPSGTSESLYAVVWSGSQFVAVSGEGGTILTSPDGRAWTAHNLGSNLPGVLGYLFDIVWSGSQFVAVGTFNQILTSPNGSTWTATPQPFKTFENYWGVTWSGSQFVVVGGAGAILTSPTGNTWTVQRSDTSSYTLVDVAWSGSQFVAVGGSGTILTSSNGSAWTVQHSETSNDLISVVWSGSQFVAVGGSGTILTSPDGKTWIAQTSGTSHPLSSVAWSGSRFVAVGESGTILTSPGSI